MNFLQVLTILLIFCVKISAKNENEFVVDYFHYKKASSIVGFSCNNDAEDFFLLKNLNQIGIYTNLNQLSNQLSTIHLVTSNYYKLGVYVDIRCYDLNTTINFFTEAGLHRMYDELHFWLVIGSNIDHITNVIDDEAFGLSTDFVIAIPTQNEKYIMYDTYNIWKERGGVLNLTFSGTWSEFQKLKVTLSGTKYVRRSNLYGLTVKTEFFKSKYQPKNVSLEDYLEDYSTHTKDGLSKFGFSIIKHLSEMFNFRIKSNASSVWKSGDTTGPIIRALFEKDIDISGSPATMNVKRTYMVKYVHQSRPFRTCFIFRNPQPKDIKINEILGPFEKKVWCLMGGFFLLSVWCMSRVLHYEKNESYHIRYSNSFLITIGAVCQQGTDMKMDFLSTRIAFLCIMLACFLLYNYYSSSIVSARLSEPIYKINDSLSELSKLNLRVSSEHMVYFNFFMKRADWETEVFYNNSWTQLTESEQFMDPEKAMELVRRGGFAYHTHPDVGYPLIGRFYDNREICDLTEVHLARPSWSTFAVNFNSTFTEMIKIGLMKISEVGVRQRQIKRWGSKKPQCQTNILSASSLNIYEFAPHLITLVLGMGLAGLICAIEMLQDRKFQKNQRELDRQRKLAIYTVEKYSKKFNVYLKWDINKFRMN